MKFVNVLREALQRGELEFLGHLATGHQVADCLTKLMDPAVLIRVLETGTLVLHAKDEDRVALSYQMQVWGTVDRTYFWGRPLVEPEPGLGSSSAVQLVEALPVVPLDSIPEGAQDESLEEELMATGSVFL